MMIIANLLIIIHLLAFLSGGQKLIFTNTAVYHLGNYIADSSTMTAIYERNGYTLRLKKKTYLDYIISGPDSDVVQASSENGARLLFYDKRLQSKISVCKSDSLDEITGISLEQNEYIQSAVGYGGHGFLLLNNHGVIYQLDSLSMEMKKIILATKLTSLHVTLNNQLFGFSSDGDIFSIDIHAKNPISKVVATGISPVFVSFGRNYVIVSDQIVIKAFDLDDFSKVITSSLGNFLPSRKMVKKLSLSSQSDILLIQSKNKLYKLYVDAHGRNIKLQDSVDGIIDFATGLYDDIVVERENSQLMLIDALIGFKQLKPSLKLQKREEKIDYGTVVPKNTFNVYRTQYEWTPPDWVATADLLVVAGGGAGGRSSTWSPGGGGGGGEVYVKENIAIDTSGKKYNLQVGNGGGFEASAPTGQSSSFENYIVVGGGSGGPTGSNGFPGGSGGGGARGRDAGASTKQIGFGNRGGSSTGVLNSGAGAGGGGGAMQPGYNSSTSNNGAHGGQGYAFLGEVFGSGGGGGQRSGSDGFGGVNAGAGGIPGVDGRNHFGGGGGGNSGRDQASHLRNGGRGGSGTVILLLKSSDGSLQEKVQFHYGSFKGEYGHGDAAEAGRYGAFFSDFTPGEKTEPEPDNYPVIGFHHGYYDGSYSSVSAQDASKQGLFFPDSDRYSFKFGEVIVNSTSDKLTRYIWKPSSKNMQLEGTQVVMLDILVVAGGGGGGCGNPASGVGGAGGGAGGVVFKSKVALNLSQEDTIIIEVGAGGRGSDGKVLKRGQNGFNSKFLAVEAVGGGGGGSRVYTQAGADGGSGGGGVGEQSAGSGTAGQGNAGGGSTNNSPGGGGGAGAKGGNGNRDNPDNASGGNGRSFSFCFGKNYGEKGYFGGGGGPGEGQTSHATDLFDGGVGGGGNGNSVNGMAHTGGGGGGGKSRIFSDAKDGGSGGSGIVLIKLYTNVTSENSAGEPGSETAALLTNIVAPVASAAIVVVGLAMAVTRYQKIQRDNMTVVDPFMAGLKEILGEDEWIYNPDYERMEGDMADMMLS